MEHTDNAIGDEGAKALGESLKVNTTLTELHLTGFILFIKSAGNTIGIEKRFCQGTELELKEMKH